MSKLHDDIVAAVAQGWCTPENSHKVMDADLVGAIIDGIEPIIDEADATIAALSAQIALAEKTNHQLQTLNDTQQEVINEQRAQLQAAEEQRDALLAAARAVVEYQFRTGVMVETVKCVQAAIALCDKAVSRFDPWYYDDKQLDCWRCKYCGGVSLGYAEGDYNDVRHLDNCSYMCDKAKGEG
jgi:hypothetical protein